MDTEVGAAGKIGQSAPPGPEYWPLDALIGRWMTTGHTFGPDGAPAAPITASDIYEWSPGGFFVLHTAYGTIGEQGAGGIEIIGYDAETRHSAPPSSIAKATSPATSYRWRERSGDGREPRFGVQGHSRTTVESWCAATNASRERPGRPRWMWHWPKST